MRRAGSRTFVYEERPAIRAAAAIVGPKEGQGPLGMDFDVVLRRLIGMDAKLAQYRDGATFVRRVEAHVRRDGLNAVWSGPEMLPTAQEITDPRAWVRRVHGFGSRRP